MSSTGAISTKVCNSQTSIFVPRRPSRSKSVEVKPRRQRGAMFAIGDGGGRVSEQQWNKDMIA